MSDWSITGAIHVVHCWLIRHLIVFFSHSKTAPSSLSAQKLPVNRLIMSSILGQVLSHRTSRIMGMWEYRLFTKLNTQIETVLRDDFFKPN